MDFSQVPKPSFFFKGFPADVRFTRHTVPESLEVARGTLYEAWYRCLKLSPYLAEAIDKEEWSNEQLRLTYERFGDLRNSSFDEWWLTRGYQIFCEDKDFRSITLSEITEDLPPNTIRFDIPLNVSPATLKKQFNELLKLHHPDYEKFDRYKFSNAQVKLRSSKLTSPSINLYLDTYEKQQELKKSNPDIHLYEVGEALNVAPEYVPKEGERNLDINNKHMMMSQTVSEYIEKARDLIANASEGVFPSIQINAMVKRSIRGPRRTDG